MNINKLNTGIVVSAMLLMSCSSQDIMIDDFESGTFNKWKVEGDAFSSTPAKGGFPGQQDVKDFQGTYLANSFNGGDDSRGTLLSKDFTIERNYINFLLGGGMHSDTYIELIVDGKSTYITRSIVESESLLQMTWDVTKYKGKTAAIKIVDNQRGGWGHILVDNIEMSNTSKSNIMPDYTLSFDASMNYLLVPVEDQGPESSVQLSVDGQKVGVPMNIRVSQTKVDHWVPINIEAYKGKPVSLTFGHVKKTDIGFTQIKQSDTFDYDYNEKYRPAYHFSPQYGWMNDPNGMVYYNGEYHLFFQSNPYGSRWANMHWGHAISSNLVKWEYKPTALAPDSIGSIFSGSAVVDKNNTAGFGKDAIVAIYTSAGALQTQSLAYSLDKGRTFTKYEHNPVLSDPKIADFRDPKVFWHQKTNQWIMSLATSQTITFYGSKNLKEWNKLSEFGQGIGNHDGVWECPDLFPLKYNGQVEWVLLVSINPGGPNGGSATQYFIGDFDGKSFNPDMTIPYPVWLDYGRDNYAGVTWNNVPDADGRRLFIGWMNNWDYANFVPTINFRSAMTLPRELKLANNGKHVVLSNYPVHELESLRSETVLLENISTDKEFVIEKLLNVNNGAYELEMEVDASESEEFVLELQNKSKEHLDFIFDLTNETFNVDRSKSGIVDINEKFASAVSKAPLTKKEKYKIRLFIDNSSSELFIDEGAVTQTNIMFPGEPYNSLLIKNKGKILKINNIKIHKLK